MKRSLSLLILVLSFSFFTACSKNSPEHAVEGFLTAIQQEDFSKAATFCDEPTGKLLNFVASMAALGEEEDSKEPLGKKGAFKILETNYSEDKKLAEVKVSFTEGDVTKTEIIPVKKVDDQWKVSINKNDLSKDEMMGKEDGETDSTGAEQAADEQWMYEEELSVQ